MARKRAMQGTVWDHRFSPIEAPDGSLLFQEWRHVRDTDIHHLWTVVEGDTGALYVVPGSHIVNRVGWAVTREPWTEADEIDGLFAIWG